MGSGRETVEPVFGVIKFAMGFQGSVCCGAWKKVRGEWSAGERGVQLSSAVEPEAEDGGGGMR